MFFLFTVVKAKTALLRALVRFLKICVLFVPLFLPKGLLPLLDRGT